MIAEQLPLGLLVEGELTYAQFDTEMNSWNDYKMNLQAGGLIVYVGASKRSLEGATEYRVHFTSGRNKQRLLRRFAYAFVAWKMPYYKQIDVKTYEDKDCKEITHCIVMVTYSL